MTVTFDVQFQHLTDNPPFPWQTALYEHFITGDFPPSCDLPTGLGKTSIIPIWLIALAAAPERVPRRLVYVVNRRTVVDQASDEAKNIREKLSSLPELRERLVSLCSASCDPPLAISTLRGQFADNGEWSADPARPAVVVGTVDMIGSRLLFSGYGRGFKSRPLHAGFLAQDVLLVHDEAHLEPAFQELLIAILKEQGSREFRRFRVMELSATSRGSEEPFRLSQADRRDPVVKRRINAKKSVTLHRIDDEKKIPEKIGDFAVEHQSSEQAILVFLRKLDDIGEVADRLKKKGTPSNAILRLTGTLRGKERDELVKEPVFQRFLPESNRDPAIPRQDGTVYLLCTSAGEVGVNISADHLVCDLTPFDSMAQRLGRVNRFGEGNARVDVVHPKDFDENKPFEVRRQKTLALLRRLDGSGSPNSLGELDRDQRLAAFTPEPVIVPISDILFDAWALTTIREELPGRPPVADFLHGFPTEWQPPQTYVAWRWEVERVTGDLLKDHPPEILLDVYPLKPHELLRDNSNRIFKQLEKLIEPRKPSASATDEERARITQSNDSRARTKVWVIDKRDRIQAETTLAEILSAGVEAIEHATLLLPPSLGGLDCGMLNGGADHDPDRNDYDVADEWFDAVVSHEDKRSEEQRRLRARPLSDAPSSPTTGRMRRVREFVLRSPEDEFATSDDEPTELIWRWLVRDRAADDDGSKSARCDQDWQEHLDSAAQHAEVIAARLALEPTEKASVIFASAWHDLGKHRAGWQSSIGNQAYPQTILAKSARPMRWRDLNGYRHEFGSLLDLLDPRDANDPCVKAFNAHAPEVKELILHLIAAHHGRARPHFPAEETVDAPNHTSAAAEKLAREVPRRFAQLQQTYGRWGLAWLESLVRAADVLASLKKDGEL